MNRKKLVTPLLLLLLLFVSIALINQKEFKKDSSELITQNQYDEWYTHSVWSINNFPKEGKRYNGHEYAWGWGIIANSLIEMYKATGDEKYLGLLVPQIEYIFSQTDEKLKIESFTGSGLYLPAWSDGGHYTDGKFNYTYPVHTGMIIIPILRFVDVVNKNNITKYEEAASEFLKESGRALAIHNQQTMWKDISQNEGFYYGHPYGEGTVSEANKIGVPNRIFAYLAACGLYDKLTREEIYTERIEKSLRYFKNSLVKYDKEYDSYYWSYWDNHNAQNWEDISHAALTTYGIFLLHEEAGFKVFNEKDLMKLKNIIFKIVENEDRPKVSKYIHERSDEQKSYYTPKENNYYFTALRWTFVGVYDERVLDHLEDVYSGLYYKEEITNTDLYSIALYLSAKEQLNK
ncbi:Glycosyl Hydrolase Family 88 [Bacillus freudenreichii]|nr:Glycosyl Hydrolase Family 88 [Bacillus freudenreichii]